MPESRGGKELVPDSASKIHFPWEKRKRTWCFSACVQRWKLSRGTRRRQVPSLVQEDPLEEEMAICSSILTWTIPYTDEPGVLG